MDNGGAILTYLFIYLLKFLLLLVINIINFPSYFQTTAKWNSLYKRLEGIIISPLIIALFLKMRFYHFPQIVLFVISSYQESYI